LEISAMRARRAEASESNVVLLDAFLRPGNCLEIVNAIEASPAREGKVVRAGVETLEPAMRVCNEHDVDANLRERIAETIGGALEAANLPVPGDAIVDGPLFVSYEPGGFFRSHRDTASHADDPGIMRSRLWSFVLYLNGRDEIDGLPSYDGGALVIYDPSLRGPHQRRVVVPEAGLLIFFRSELLHQVMPVREGTRYAAIGWICANSQSEGKLSP
jgi:predicted 2-oxoglutarate/Fe(II)-dependent dioxygenase YbiX